MMTFEEEKDIMTFEEAKDIFLNRGWVKTEGSGTYFDGSKWREAVMVLSDYLQREPCEDCISRQAVLNAMSELNAISFYEAQEDSKECYYEIQKMIKNMSFVQSQPKMKHCKDCKFFEYDSVAKVDGIPLIVAHEICSRWGDGCKTKEDGYCFLFEPKIQEVKEE